jgi:hypothetical protein
MSEPTGLGTAGRALWDAVTAKWVLRPDESTVLEMAARTTDDVARLQDALEGADLLLTGSARQPIAHPLLAELRMSRALLGQQLRQLALADDVPREAKSPRHVRAAQARWANQRTGS